MLLDLLAAIARKDYEDRRRRQSQGIAKAKSEGAYKGRPEDKDRNAAIRKMRHRGKAGIPLFRQQGVRGQLCRGLQSKREASLFNS